MCCDLQEELKNDSQFLTKVLTGDESFCYSYETEFKQQSHQWKSPNMPRPNKAWQVSSSVKTIIISFFDVDGILHRQFVPPRQTVNQQFYLNVLKQLYETGYNENVQKSGRVGISSCTMTMPLSLQHPAIFGQEQNGG